MKNQQKKFDPSLYFILNLPSIQPPFQLAQKAIQGGVTTIQLRGKNSDAASLYALAVELKPYLDAHHVTLIINDRLDVALAAQADGVHLGKNDLPLIQSRLLAPDLIIGVSCYGDLKRAQYATKHHADYIAFGAFFPSPTKPNAPQIPLSILQEASTLQVPIIAIGGITPPRASQLIQNGADGVAIISAIQEASDPQKAAQNFIHHIKIS